MFSQERAYIYNITIDYKDGLFVINNSKVKFNIKSHIIKIEGSL